MGAHDGTLRGPATNFDAYLDDTLLKIAEGDGMVMAQVAGNSLVTTTIMGMSQAKEETTGESLID